MAKISLFASTEEMLEQAKAFMDRKGIHNVELLLSNNATVVDDAVNAAARGVEIIIARGNFSSLIRRYTKMPVVDIVLTVQEMGLLIKKAKAILEKESPVIGVVGVRNLFCDMRYFENIFGIILKTYLVDNIDELKTATEQAISDGVDIVFGGQKVLGFLADSDIPRLFISSTEDSIQQAFQIAASVEYAFDMEKKNSVELRTLLDYSFNSIIRINNAGEIVALNHLAETMLKVKSADIIAKPIHELLGEFDRQQLDGVLRDGREVFATITHFNNKAFVYNLVPITINGRIDGAIMSGHEIDKLNKLEADTRKRHYSQKELPKFTFAWMEQNVVLSDDIYKMAARFAQSSAPILILGGAGFEAEILAQSIHNASKRKSNPYMSAKCAAYQDEDQLKHLFGTGSNKLGDSIISDAHNGTLFIDEIDALSQQAQYRILKLVTENASIQGRDYRPLPVNVKLIAASRKNLWELVASGQFREDLYHALSTLMITLAPLHERKDEISRWVDRYVAQFSDTYARYISLTQGARRLLIEYPWQSNVPQLRSFCEKLVLSSPKRSVDEIIVSQLLQETYPIIKKMSPEPIVVYQDPEASLISELLAKHNGNRKNVANEMNISTTTLWRKIKKYRITPSAFHLS